MYIFQHEEKRDEANPYSSLSCEDLLKTIALTGGSRQTSEIKALMYIDLKWK